VFLNIFCRPEDKTQYNIRDLKEPVQCDQPDITGISADTTLFVNESIQLDCVTKKESELILFIVTYYFENGNKVTSGYLCNRQLKKDSALH